MAHHQLIGPSPTSSSSSLLRTGKRGFDIPEDLLHEASRRLGILSLLGAVLWTVGTIAGHIANSVLIRANARWGTYESTDTIAVVMVTVSLALFAFTRRSKRDPSVILEIGLVYLVISSLALGMLWHVGDLPHGYQLMTQISW